MKIQHNNEMTHCRNTSTIDSNR